LLSFYDKDMKWVVEPGSFTIMVGTASDETQSIKLNVVK
jgi:beta-glucosidase